MSDHNTQELSDKCAGESTPQKWYVAFQRDAQRAAAYQTPYVEQRAERNPRSYLIGKPRNSA